MVKITGYDRGGLLRDIAAVVAAENVNMSSVSVSTQKSIATFFATLEIASISQLSRVLTKIDRIPNIIEVQRHTGYRRHRRRLSLPEAFRKNKRGA